LTTVFGSKKQIEDRERRQGIDSSLEASQAGSEAIKVQDETISRGSEFKQRFSTNIEKDASNFGSIAGEIGLAKGRAKTENEIAQVRKASLNLEEQFKGSVKARIDAGLEEADIRRFANGTLSKLNSENEKALRQYVETTLAARESVRQLAEANFDSLKISSAFSGAFDGVKKFRQGLDLGTSSLEGYVEAVKSAQGKIGIDVTSEIESLQSSLVGRARSAGASEDTIAAIESQGNVKLAASQFNRDIGQKIASEQLSISDTAEAKEQIKNLLEDAIPENADAGTRKKIKAIIDNQVGSIDPVTTIDPAKLLSTISAEVGQLASGFDESTEIFAKFNTDLIKLSNERIEAERRYGEALNGAITTQLEAGKLFQEFGGAKLTLDQRKNAISAQFNNTASAGRLDTRLGSGSSQDIRRVSAELLETFNRQQSAEVAATAAGGPSVFKDDPSKDLREETKRSQQELIKGIKERISLQQEELRIADAKNKAEQDALDKLIGGDIEGFISGQAAAGAGAALRSGSANLSNLFSGSALGQGFKGLKDQGLDDASLRRAGGLTLSRFGINDERSAGVLMGSSPEQEALKAEGRDLSSTLGLVAQQSADMERGQIDIKQAQITAENVIFNRDLAAVSNQNAAPAAPAAPPLALANGGIVYANRGMFVPRGTDTVPAMLTPGEFVVNRSAVRRGNNLQTLRTMNSGAGASSPTHMRSGGQVRYYNNGGTVDNTSSVFSNALPQLSNIFNSFSSAVDKLVGSQFTVRLDPTNINVNFNGTSFLESVKEDIKKELLDHVSREITNYKLNSSGDLEKRRSVN
jgi:hypothetical protein